MVELNVGLKQVEAMGFPTSWRITSDMAEFYVLERLAHDDKQRFGAAYEKHVASLAPRLARYNVAICGGELRHLPTQGYDDYDCYEEHGGECGCHCYECHYDSYHEHDEDCYPDPTYDDEDDEGHASDCECFYCDCDEPTCGQDEGADCGYEGFEERECDCNTNPDWDQNVANDVAELIYEIDREGYGRNGSWQQVLEVYDALDKGDRAKLVRNMAHAFDPDLWSGGYGGETWQTVAELTAHYLAGKLKPATFIDRCWSLEHNGGNIFNKMFNYETCERLMNLLIVQARGDYQVLVGRCRTDIARLWGQRNMFLRAEFDDVWLGTQNIWIDEEVA